MFEVIHVYYFVASVVFSDRIMFFGNPRVVLCRRQSFSRPDRVSGNPRVLLRRPRGFSGPEHVRRNPRVLLRRSLGFS